MHRHITTLQVYPVIKAIPFQHIRSALLLVIAIFSGNTWASTLCTNVTAALSPPQSSLTWGGLTTAGTVILNTNLVATVQCSGVSGSSGNPFQLSFAIDSTVQTATATRGVYLQTVGTATRSISGGNCTYLFLFQPGSGFTAYQFRSDSAATCTITLTQPVKFVLSGGGIGNSDAFASALGLVYSLGYDNAGPYQNGYVYGLAAPPSLVISGIRSCTVSPSSLSINVVLPTVSKAALASAGKTAGRTAFNLDLAGCLYGGTNYVASADWSWTTGANSTLIALDSGSTAGNLNIQLLDSNLAAFSPGLKSIANIVAAGPQSSRFFAQYYATGVVTPGSVKATAVFTMSYL